MSTTSGKTILATWDLAETSKTPAPESFFLKKYSNDPNYTPPGIPDEFTLSSESTFPDDARQVVNLHDLKKGGKYYCQYKIHHLIGLCVVETTFLEK